MKLNDSTTGELNNLSEILKELFNETSRLKIEYNRPYSKVSYSTIEWLYIDFLNVLMENEFSTKTNDSDFEKLIEESCLAYAFYIRKDNNKKDIIERLAGLTTKYDEKQIEKLLYDGLIKHYSILNNNFSDIEKGLELLLKNYEPSYKINEATMTKELERLPEVLFYLIKQSGSYGDVGLAYNGLEIIKVYIDRLDDAITDSVLDKLSDSLVEYINEKTYNQIVAVITGKYKDEISESKRLYYLNCAYLIYSCSEAVKKKYSSNNNCSYREALLGKFQDENEVFTNVIVKENNIEIVKLIKVVSGNRNEFQFRFEFFKQSNPENKETLYLFVNDKMISVKKNKSENLIDEPYSYNWKFDDYKNFRKYVDKTFLEKFNSCINEILGDKWNIEEIDQIEDKVQVVKIEQLEDKDYSVEVEQSEEKEHSVEIEQNEDKEQSVDTEQIEDKEQVVKIEQLEDKEQSVEIAQIEGKVQSVEIKQIEYKEEMLDKDRGFYLKHTDSNINSQHNFKDERVFLSTIYLKGYGKYDNNFLSLDNEFKFIDKIESKNDTKNDETKSSIIRNEKNTIKNFYGENLESLSLLLGCNGAGKTTILHFMKNYMSDIINYKKEIAQQEFEYFIIMKKVNENETKFFYKTNMDLEQNLDISTDIVKDMGFNCLNDGDFKVLFLTNVDDFNETANEFNQVNRLRERNVIDLSKRHLGMYNNIVMDFEKRRKSNDSTDKDNNSKAYRYLNVNKEFIIQIIFLRYYLLVKVSKEKNETDKYKLPFINLDNYDITFANKSSKKEKIDLYRLDCKFAFSKNESDCVEKTNINTELNNFLNKIDGLLKDDKLIDLRNNYFKLLHFSTGEYARFTLFAKLYWHIQGCEVLKRDYEKLYNYYFEGDKIDDSLQKTSIIAIDEGELYYHPEWQRTFISDIVNAVDCFTNVNTKEGGSEIEKILDNDKKENDLFNKKKVQLVLTSNSPFLLSDLPKESINILGKEEMEKNNTFAQNIHLLLTDTMFLSETIGEFAKNKIIGISKIIGELVEKPNGETFKYENKTYQKSDLISLLNDRIHFIGEPVTKNLLLSKLRSVSENDENSVMIVAKEYLQNLSEEQIKSILNELNINN